MSRTDTLVPPPVQQQWASSWMVLVLLLFIASGCSALIYEIVWLQLLQLVIGSSAVSLGVLLGTFMGGMCLGSLLLPRFLSPRRHPLRVYAALEAGIGLIGLALLFLLPAADRFYAALIGHGRTGIAMRALLAGICLLPPTLLMGATLPAIARWVQATPRGISWLGFFYGGNTFGAVLGCLLAGFYLLRIHDMPTATYVAVVLNAGVALLALLLASIAPVSAPNAGPSTLLEGAREGAGGGHTPSGGILKGPHRKQTVTYGVIALSGFSALGAEVVWTRLISLMLGGTVYTFSIILAVFLTGLGLGSTAGAVWARRARRPWLALGSCQALLLLAITWTSWVLSSLPPFWPIGPENATEPWVIFRHDLVCCLWAILPPACCWGASFPLALAAAAHGQSDTGRMVGAVYAANTLGAILGSLLFSLLLIGTIGTHHAQQLLLAIAALAAVLVFVNALRPRPGRSAGATPWLGLAGTLIAAAVCIPTIPTTPWQLVAYGRWAHTWMDHSALLYEGEGMNSSVAVTLFNGARNFHVSGKVEASSEPQDMRLQRMLGHLPALLHPHPRSVLVVGCGAGVTAGSFTTYPQMDRLVICEIEPLVPKVVAKYFAAENYDVVNWSKTHLVFDDARHFVLTTPEQFDIITSDPIHPWVKGAATLYTHEYFEMCKRHLKPGGIVSQWVPLYESNADAVKSEIATFMQVFPHGTIWSNETESGGYDLVLVGQNEPLHVNLDELQARLAQEDHTAVWASLRQVGFFSSLHLLATYAGSAQDLAPWLQDAQINRDLNLRLQYLAGRGLNNYQSERIFEDMLRYGRFPEDLFSGTQDQIMVLRDLMERRQRTPQQ